MYPIIMKRLPKKLLTLLDSGIVPAFYKLHEKSRNRFAREFMEHRKAIGRKPAWTESGKLAVEVVEFLAGRIETLTAGIERLQHLLDDFNYRYSRANTRRERRVQVLEFSRQLGAGYWQLWGDRRAFSRWFGHDAITERCLRKIADKEADLIFVLTLMGALSKKALSDGAEKSRQRQVWQQLKLEQHLTGLLTYSGDNRVRLHAFKCLVSAIRLLDGQLRKNSLAQNTVTFIYRSALESREDTWIQVEALNLLRHLSPATLETVIEKRLTQPKDGEDLFVRRRCAVLLGQVLDRLTGGADLLWTAAKDRSAYVRQAAAESAGTALQKKADSRIWETLQALAEKDSAPEVRAKVMLACIPLIDTENCFYSVLQLWTRGISQETNVFVRRTALKAISAAAELIEAKSNRMQTYCDAVIPLLEELHVSDDNIFIRRQCAQTRERLSVLADPALENLSGRLKQKLQALRPGKSVKIPWQTLPKTDLSRIYRTLSVMAQKDYGFTISHAFGGLRIWRGDVYVFRLWRLFFEFFHPSPYKRQGYKHTIGRKLFGRVRIPSAITAELSRTNVPGEPLFMPEEEGWRPYLPLVDEVFSSLFLTVSAKPVLIYTSEGITEVVPPRSLFKRFQAWWKLTTRFSGFADLRNWTPGSRYLPADYTSSLAALGFDFSFKGYTGSNGQPDTDSEVQKFFPGLVPFLTPGTWQAFKDYFFSIYGNTLYELGIFAGALLLIFAGRQIYLSYMGRRARKRLPLVIGGWGTRGKSGTERLKAAVFEALGHGTLSKTTGTEPMFLMANPLGKTREMMLFRPYEKATIWEQHAMNRWAASMDTRVLLWECMGLNPAYVSILQKHWCRDDYSTITNAYPDHEDIQGPAGINIPKVMSEFIPANRTLVTAEEQMRPVLEAAAREKNTDFKSVDWLDAGMIPPDILERFVYQEHPYNIALVLKLSRELGVDSDFALKEMADRVVPDIGALKAYPEAFRGFRRMEFVNGMAANERFATLSNWRRMGFAGDESSDVAEQLQSVLVNNRADRVSRSEMFGGIIVEDLSVDHIVLIGSNLTGLMGYIRDAWQTYMEKHDFSRDSQQELLRAAGHLRLPTDQSMVKQRLAAMLAPLDLGAEVRKNLLKLWHEPQQLKSGLQNNGLSSVADDIADQIQQYSRQYTEFAAISEKIENGGLLGTADLAESISEFLKKWFFNKIHIVDDPHVSGEFIVNRLFDISPPGLLHRVMGIQNIKGPGLDFVYRWQSWQTCYQACNKLRSDDENVVRTGLHELSAFQDYGLLCEDYVKETIEYTRTRSVAQSEHFQAGLEVIEKTMEDRLSSIRDFLQATGRRNRAFVPIFHFLESFLDAGDGIRRRKAANRIYRDLKKGRVSQDRAATELNQLHNRQKGGWLFDQLMGMLRKITGSPTTGPG
ncbi:MAG: hypothetical protein KGY38_00795 [Desulfobacterales bacterium]|nr:hypothetical protein [Desulfobacterales bacterium]